MDSHLQHAQVDHSLRKYDAGKLCRNVPNAYKRNIWFRDTDVKGVQESSRDNGGSGRTGNSLDSDLYCGNKNTGYQGLPVVSKRCLVRFEWGQRRSDDL